jgi:AcrR family transcriptional regulator
MVDVMSDPIGRREANRRATTDAIKLAARDLFAAQGYEGTSVREIAVAAGVAERTFYRYFDGKEGLLADEVGRWIGRLHDAIVERPAHERPLTAVQQALVSMSQRFGEGSPDAPIWLFTNQPRAFEILQKSAPRPLVRFEGAITDALLARAEHPGDARARFDAELVARVSVAVVRSAAIGHRQLRADEPSRAPSLQKTLQQAFALLREAVLGP